MLDLKTECAAYFRSNCSLFTEWIHCLCRHGLNVIFMFAIVDENPSWIFCFLEMSCHSVLFSLPILSSSAVFRWLGDVLIFHPYIFLSRQNSVRQPLLNLERKKKLVFLDIQFKTVAKRESSRKCELNIIWTNIKTREKERDALVYVRNTRLN